MKVKIFSLVFMAVLSTSLMACGTTNAKRDSNIGEKADSAASETMEYGPIDGVPAGAEFVEKTEALVEVESTEPVPESDVVEAGGEEYTGSLYTLPVAKKGEEWSEAQLDEYLASSKAFKKAYDGETFDFDVFMKALGFKNVGTISGSSLTLNRYYYENGKFKIMCCPVCEDSEFYIYIDNSQESVLVREYPIDYDESITIICAGLPNDMMKTKLNKITVKSVAATMEYLIHSKTKDCARLPSGIDYSFEYGGEGSILNMDYNPIETPIITMDRKNPYRY